MYEDVAMGTKKVEDHNEEVVLGKKC